MLAVETLNARTEYLDERPVGGCTASLPASSPHHAHSARRRIAGDLLGKTSLADAWLTRDHEQTSAPGDSAVETCVQLRQLALSADKAVTARALGSGFGTHFAGPPAWMRPEVPTFSRCQPCYKGEKHSRKLLRYGLP